MHSCQLTKLESALDTLKKAFPKLAPADAALLASALTLTGRHALAVYEDQRYSWPQDYQKLTMAMIPQIKLIQETVEGTKKAIKAAGEEEPVQITVGLTPNLSAGEALLEGRNDLKVVLSDILQEGVEFNYAPNDIGWQWALDRANWNTVVGSELTRKVRVKTYFAEGAVGVETGTAPKKRASRKAETPEAEPAEAVA